MKWMLALVAVVSLGTAGCSKSDNRRVMNAAEIKSLFAGKTVTGRHDKRGYTFRSFYEPSGAFRSYQGGKKTPKTGKWWTTSGGQICVRWQGGDRDWCRNMVTDGKGKYWKVLIKGRKRIAIVTFQSFTAGNAKKL